MQVFGLEWAPQFRFVLALGLGLLVGLERERAAWQTKSPLLAGVRTHTIISLYGFACAWLFQMQVPLLLPVGLVTVAVLAAVGYRAKAREGHLGWTSEIAVLMTFAVGALALLADVWIPLALGILHAVILSEKNEIEGAARKLDDAEFLAVLKFLIVTMIVLPALPNREYTEFQLNPRRMWLIVTMVSSIGFAGYFMAKRWGQQAGWWLSGVLGGIASSTAVSIAAGRMAQRNPNEARHALQAAVLASSVMYLRILVLIWIVNRAFVPHLWWRLGGLCGAGFLLALAQRPSKAQDQTPSLHGANPFELRPALVFAAVFSGLSILTVLVRKELGNAGLLALSAVVGATDIDPFLLSLMRGTTQADRIVVPAVLLAMMSNTVVKGIYFGSLAKTVRRETAWRFGLLALLHVPFALIP